METACIHAQDNKIRKEKDIYGIILPKSLSRIKEDNAQLDITHISELIHKCKIKESDINILREVWNLDITDKKRGERQC